MRARNRHATPREASLAPAGTAHPEHNTGLSGRVRSSVKHRSAMVFAIALLLSLAVLLGDVDQS